MTIYKDKIKCDCGAMIEKKDIPEWPKEKHVCECSVVYWFNKGWLCMSNGESVNFYAQKKES